MACLFGSTQKTCSEAAWEGHLQRLTIGVLTQRLSLLKYEAYFGLSDAVLLEHFDRSKFRCKAILIPSISDRMKVSVGRLGVWEGTIGDKFE